MPESLVQMSGGSLIVDGSRHLHVIASATYLTIEGCITSSLINELHIKIHLVALMLFLIDHITIFPQLWGHSPRLVPKPRNSSFSSLKMQETIRRGMDRATVKLLTLHQNKKVGYAESGCCKMLGFIPRELAQYMSALRDKYCLSFEKFGLYLKSLSGVAQQGGIPNSYFGPLEQNRNHGSLGRFDIQALIASGQILPQTLAALHAEFLGRPTDSKTLCEEKRGELYENLKTNESIRWEVDVIDPRSSELKC